MRDASSYHRDDELMDLNEVLRLVVGEAQSLSLRPTTMSAPSEAIRARVRFAGPRAC
jgi:hypothetical protein